MKHFGVSGILICIFWKNKSYAIQSWTYNITCSLSQARPSSIKLWSTHLSVHPIVLLFVLGYPSVLCILCSLFLNFSFLPHTLLILLSSSSLPFSVSFSFPFFLLFYDAWQCLHLMPKIIITPKHLSFSNTLIIISDYWWVTSLVKIGQCVTSIGPKYNVFPQSWPACGPRGSKWDTPLWYPSVILSLQTSRRIACWKRRPKWSTLRVLWLLCHGRDSRLCCGGECELYCWKSGWLRAIHGCKWGQPRLEWDHEEL